VNLYRALLLVAVSLAGTAHAQLNVVATLSTFGDLVQQVGGKHVEVYSIAPPQFNPHFVEPRPSDVLKLKKADVFVNGGLDLEAWREPLLNAAGNAKADKGGEGEIALSDGVQILNVPAPGVTRAQGDVHAMGNPHYWLGPENGLIMAATIARRLSEIDPPNAADYEANRAAFEEKLKAKITEWKAALAPLANSEMIAFHDEWPYLAAFAGIKIEQFLEPKPGIPPGPKHLAELEEYAVKNGVKGIIYTSITPAKPAESLSKKTGVPAIELAQGVGEVKEATDYIALIDHDIASLVAAAGK
jgi:ABC-type Zn uptake system ZnuABC Zn-binding protein ZnuA